MKNYSPICFEQAQNFSSNYPFIILNTQGRTFEPEIPISMLTFNIDQYNLTIIKDPISYKNAFNPVNNFFSTLNEDDTRAFVSSYVFMQYNISHRCNNRNDFKSCLDTCANTISALVKDTDLFNKLYDYTVKHIPVDDMSQSGFRPQDKHEMTFGQNEVYALTSIALLCKLFTPIFSELLNLGKYRGYSVNGFAEIDCSHILTDALAHHESLILKLKFYIRSLIMNITKKQTETAVSAYHGQTDISLLYKILSIILVKKFVTENINNGNITKAITTATRTTTDSLFKNAKSKLDVTKRGDPDDTENEEGNLSRMESESKPSKYPGDHNIILAHQALDTWNDIIDQYKCDRDVILSACTFYERHPAPPNSLSSFLMTNYFGELFGGGKYMNYLNLTTKIKLVSLMQYLMFQNNSIALVHALSMQKCTKIKANVSLEDRQLSLVWTSNTEYKKCNDELPSGFGEKSWDSRLKEIVDELVASNMIYSTAPVFWELLKEPSQNGQYIPNFLRMIKDSLILTHHIYTREPGLL